MSRKPISAKEMEEAEVFWRSAKPLEALLPLKTPSPVDVVITEVGGQCAACGETIKPGWIRGKLTEHPNGVQEVQAMGICCKTQTKFLWRLRPEGTLQSLVGHRWVTIPIEMDTSPAWWDLSGWLRRLFR